MIKILQTFFLLLFIINPTIAQTSRIIDGDTLEAKIINKYRLAGIDAPEQNQPFGEQASQKLKELLENNELAGIWCLPKADKYGRDICILSLNTLDGSKIDPAEELIKAGLAEVEYTQFLPPSTELIYRTAEEKAKQAKLGIWKQQNYIKPAQWRKNSKN